MRTTLDTPQRLQRLERILAGAMPAPRTADDAARRALDRIDQLTQLLENPPGESDGVNAVAMRILLNDYTAMVGLLRAATQQAGDRLQKVSPVLEDVRRFLWRDDKLRATAQQAIEGTGRDDEEHD